MFISKQRHTNSHWTKTTQSHGLSQTPKIDMTTIKSQETTRIYLDNSPPRGAPPNWVSTIKLGGFRKVPEVIKHAKRHLDRRS